MRKWTKVLALILGVAVLASVALVGSVALAADPQPTSPPTTSTTSPVDIFLSKLAARLNVPVDQLKSAFTQARTDTINQLAANGTITAAQKDWMLERAQQATQGGFGPGMMGSGFGPRGRGAFNGSTPWGGTPPWNQVPPTPTK